MTAVPATPAEPPAFSAPVMLSLVAVCLICFAAFAVLSANAPDGRSSPSSRAGVTSRAATGFSGAVTLLKAMHIQVTVEPRPARGYPQGKLVILTPSADAQPLTLDDLDYGEGVPVLIVLPKWRTAPDRANPNRVRKLGLVEEARLASLVKALGPVTVSRGPGKAAPPPPGSSPDTFYAVDIDAPQVLNGDGWDTLLEEPGLGAVVAASPVEGVYVLADPDMLNNHGLSHRENARGALAMIDGLRAPGAGVAFLTGPGGLGAGSLAALLKPPLLGAALCALAAVLLMGLQALTRFGPAAEGGRAYALGARGLVDNSAALVRMARKEHLLAPAYADMVEAAAAKAAGADRLAGEERLQRLERLARRRGVSDSINQLAVAAARARNRTELLAVARRLYEWKREMTREAR